MKKLSYLIVLVLILGLVLAGCTLFSNVGQIPTAEQSEISDMNKIVEEGCTVNLIAGQFEDVGQVTVTYDGSALVITYETDFPWLIYETHLHIASNPDDFPQKKGNPIPGKFDYKHENLGGIPIDEYIIPLGDLPEGWSSSGELFFAAHAVVKVPYSRDKVVVEEYDQQEETAWGEGEDFPGKNWAMYFMCDVLPSGVL